MVVSGEAIALPRKSGSVDRWTVGAGKPKRGPQQNAKARVAALRSATDHGALGFRRGTFANPPPPHALSRGQITIHLIQLYKALGGGLAYE